MADIKAIETHYNGYRFRSRLEARWAVFFDAVGIPYVYEPQGFVLSDGTCYLPDFYLPWFDAYVEIKSKFIYLDEKKEAERKLEMLFCSDNIECVTMLFIGDPLDQDMNVFCNYTDSEGGGTTWFSGRFVEGAWYYNDKDIPGHLNEIADEYGYSKHYILFNCFSDSKMRYFANNKYNDCCLECENRCNYIRNDFEYAAKKARQARFEHGECG